MTSHAFFFPPPSLHQPPNSHTWLLVSLLNYLPPWPQCHYLFIHSYLQGKGLVGVPACTQLHTFSSAEMEEPKHLQQAWRWDLDRLLSAQGCCEGCRLGTSGAGTAPATDWRQEIKAALPGSHWNCFALWVALMIKLSSLKIKSASCTTISAFQGIAEVPVRTLCRLKCLSWVTINLINKNHSKFLSSKLTWQQQFSPLWLHLLPIAQSYFVSAGLHTVFCFVFLFSSQYQTALRSHYFYQLELFWRIFLYKHLRKVAHYNPITVVFFPPTLISSLLHDYFAVSPLQKYSVLQLQITDAFQTNSWGCHSGAAEAAEAALFENRRDLSRASLQGQAQLQASLQLFPLTATWAEERWDHRGLQHSGLGVGSNRSKRGTKRTLLKDGHSCTVGNTWQVVLLGP